MLDAAGAAEVAPARDAAEALAGATKLAPELDVAGAAKLAPEGEAADALAGAAKLALELDMADAAVMSMARRRKSAIVTLIRCQTSASKVPGS